MASIVRLAPGTTLLPMSIQRLIWPLVALLFLGVAGLALYRAWPILFPSLFASAPLDPACDLRQGPCASEIPGLGRFLFEIERRPSNLVYHFFMIIDQKVKRKPRRQSRRMKQHLSDSDRTLVNCLKFN